MGDTWRMIERGDILRVASDAVDAEIIESSYYELRRFAAVVAPWDIDPDDVLHSVLVKVLRKRSLGSLEDPQAYLRRSIVNYINSEMRRRGTRRSVVNRLGTSHAGADQYPSDLADLLRLSPADRAILYLHDVEGFGFDEVAGRVGMTAGRARMRASRARSRLREMLTEETQL
jgi:RNA polymerase sigma factor (sigma-70 family)